MKRTTVLAALILVASMFLASTWAFAIAVTPTWTSGLERVYDGSAGQQINKVSISLTDDIYKVDLWLGDKPVTGTTYSVLIGDSSDIFDSYDYFLDANAYNRRSTLLTVGFSAGDLDSGSAIPFGASWDNKNTLTWLVDKSDIFNGDNFWFAGQSTETNEPIIYSETKATVTPIPGAAWLLGSGILGLVAMRRRNAGLA